MTAPNPNKPAGITREEFEDFLHLFTHEIRNRLNAISLEATDMTEQAGASADATRLQQQVRDCSAFLKKVREMLAPEDPHAKKMTLSEVMKKLHEQKNGTEA